MRKTRYPKEKVVEAIRMVLEDGQSQTKVAKNLRLPLQTVNYWVKAKETELNKGKGAVTGNPMLSPIASITFGAALAQLRFQSSSTERVLSTDEFARRLGIGGSTLRMMESGQHIPAITLSYPLATELGLSLPMTVLVIGFVRAIDSSKSKEKACEIAEEFAKQEPRFGFFSRKLIDALQIELKERNRLLKSEELVVKTLDLMRTQSHYSVERGGISDPILSELSPVLLDAVRALSSKLNIFNQALDPTSLNKWETINSRRIRRVWSYYKDATFLCETITKYKLEFLREGKPLRPQYVVITKEAGDDSKRVLSTLQKRLKNLKDKLIAVNERPLSKDVDKDFSRALLFDLTDGVTSLSQAEDTSEEYTKKNGQGRYIRMTTINCYEIEDDIGVTYCAFIDNSRSSQKSGQQSDFFYARALRQTDTDKVFDLFKRAGAEMGLTF